MKALKTTIKWIIAIVVICLAAYFLASFNGLSISRNIASVNGSKLTQAEYKYYLEVTKEQMLTEAGAAATEDFWKTEIDGKNAADVARERAMDELIRTEIAAQKAKDAGITLSEDDLASIKAMFSDNSAAAKEQLKELEKTTGADKYQLSDIMEKLFLSNAYYQSLMAQEDALFQVDDAQVAAKAEEDYAAVKHVLIMNAPQDGTEASDTEAYAAEAKAKAEDVLAKALKGDSFEKLIVDFGEDPGMESNVEGYLIDKAGTSVDGSGSMVPEFTNGAFAVAAGQVNPELVESSYGWHIIKRYPLPKENQGYKSILSATENELSTDAYNAYLDGFKDEMTIEIEEKIYKNIKVK